MFRKVYQQFIINIMGCMSEKVKKDDLVAQPYRGPKSSLINPSQQFKMECKICFSEYDENDRTPMSLPCYHTVCLSCLNSMNKKQCPFDHKPFSSFGKNYELLSFIESLKGKLLKVKQVKCQSKPLNNDQLIQPKQKKQILLQPITLPDQLQPRRVADVQLNLDRIRPPQRIFNPRRINQHNPLQHAHSNPCHISHNFSFLSYEIKCNQCQQVGRCWQCSRCRTKKCINCHPTQMKGEKCPNKHTTKWVNNISKCIKCERLSSGRNCVQCAYTLCDDCSRTKFTKNCPNLHESKWVSYRDRCVKCHNFSRGFHCVNCSYHYCENCDNTIFSPDYCPNNHRTVTKNIRSTCTKCGGIEGGHGCNTCVYHFCNKCK